MKTYIIGLLVFTLFNSASGQIAPSKVALIGNTKIDTIYYLVDTLHIPIRDRMITHSTTQQYTFYSLKCPCLQAHNLPVFRTNLSEQTVISKQEYLKYKLTDLSQLIGLVISNDDDHFADRFKIFFLFPSGQNFTRQQVYFLGGRVTKVE